MSTKEPTDWSEDEQKLAKEYEKKVKDLQEEREKYRKVSIMQCKMVAVYAGRLEPMIVLTTSCFNKCIGDFKLLTITKNLLH